MLLRVVMAAELTTYAPDDAQQRTSWTLVQHVRVFQQQPTALLPGVLVIIPPARTSRTAHCISAHTLLGCFQLTAPDNTVVILDWQLNEIRHIVQMHLQILHVSFNPEDETRVRRCYT